MRANVPPRASRAPSLSDRNYMAAPTAGVSDANRFPGKSAGRTERALLWGFTAGLAWCPFWFGGSVLLAWGINAVLFPGLVVIYELSLLIRGEHHPVAIRLIASTRARIAKLGRPVSRTSGDPHDTVAADWVVKPDPRAPHFALLPTEGD